MFVVFDFDVIGVDFLFVVVFDEFFVVFDESGFVVVIVLLGIGKMIFVLFLIVFCGVGCVIVIQLCCVVVCVVV